MKLWTVSPEMFAPSVSHSYPWRGTGNFFQRNRAELGELFRLFERPWDETLKQAVSLTQPWVRGDHFSPEHALHLTPEQESRARGIYARMGLIHGSDLPAGRYDHVVVLGGTQRANDARLVYLRRQIARPDVEITGSVSLWGGVRTLFDMEREAIRVQVNKLRGAYPRDPWLEMATSTRQLDTEAEALRLAAWTRLGELSLRRVDLNIGSNTSELSGGPIVRSWTFSCGGYEMILLNTAAVVRLGAPRHTTEACARHWAQQVPLPEHARVAFVTSNPSGLRTTRVVQGTINKLKRPDVEIVGGGPGAYPDATDALFRGEIGRNLYEDQRRAI
jgi:hypothetical protein